MDREAYQDPGETSQLRSRGEPFPTGKVGTACKGREKYLSHAMPTKGGARAPTGISRTIMEKRPAHASFEGTAHRRLPRHRREKLHHITVSGRICSRIDSCCAEQPFQAKEKGLCGDGWYG